MHNPARAVLPKQWRSRLVVLVLFLLLLYIVLPRLHSFSESFTALQHALPTYALGAQLAIVCSYLFAAFIYVQLSLRHLPYWPTLQIQMATAFANRLLPAGLGGMGLYTQYLRRKQHTLAEAIAIAATNNGLGMAAHGILLVIVLATGTQALGQLHGIHITKTMLVILLAVLLIIIATTFIYARVRQALKTFANQFIQQLWAYRRAPWRLGAALVGAMCLTLCHVVALYLCAAAVGISISLWVAFIVFTVGIAAGTATPTPGGIGGVEAGLLAGLVGYGAAASPALAAVLLYRLVSYWLLLIPGFFVFLRVRHRYL